ERADHDLKMGNAVVAIERDEIDAVDPDAVDDGFEFQHGAGVVAPLAEISESGNAEDFHGACQIFEGDVASALRRMDDGTFQDGIRMEQVPERLAVTGLHDAVPFRKTGR